MTIAAWTVRKPTKNWIDRNCLICDTQFKAEPWRVRKGWGKYCSEKCRNIFAGKMATLDIKGSKNPNYKGTPHPRYHNTLLFRKKYPEKAKAHDIVKKAKRRGILTPKDCEKCGEKNNIQAHHEDYSKPLIVIWLCVPCHHKVHYP